MDCEKNQAGVLIKKMRQPEWGTRSRRHAVPAAFKLLHIRRNFNCSRFFLGFI
jgi:hypothetical protein